METNYIQTLNTLILLYIKIILKIILYIKSTPIETMTWVHQKLEIK